MTGLLADLSLRARFDDWRPRRDTLPIPSFASWTDAKLELVDAELRVEGGALVLLVFESATKARELFAAHFDCDQRVSLGLANGSRVEAAMISELHSGGQTRRDGSCAQGVRVTLAHWSWLPPAGDDLVIAMTLEGSNVPPGRNLALVNADSGFDVGHFRGSGTFDWHVLPDGEALFALATFDGLRTSIASVCRDLMALEFVSGSTYDVTVAWVVDREGRTVGAFGFGGLPGVSHRARPPVPAEYYLRECWAASLFRLLAAKLAESEADLTIPIVGYLDAQRTHIHGGYLLGQVALEAFCGRVMPASEPPNLVPHPRLWQAWVDERRDEILKFAVSEADGPTLLNRARNAFQRPSSSKVSRAFNGWGIELPRDVAQEIARRNIVAHRFVLFDEETGSAQKAIDQLECVQTLLVAAVAKHIGYVGPIAGWSRDEMGRRRAPPFWDPHPMEDAMTRFECRRP